MKHLLLLAAIVFCLFSCGQKTKTQTASAINGTAPDGIEILYFHGKQRCITCNAIENLTKEVLESKFEEQVKNGTIRFTSIDISTKEGEILADRYEVTWSSLFINKWQNGKETRNNLTELGFAKAKNFPEDFKIEIEKVIADL